MSSSNALRVAQVAPIDGTFASWTPELVVAGSRTAFDPIATRKTVEELIVDAVEFAREEARLREEELVRELAAERAALTEEAYQRGFDAGERAEGARLRNAATAVNEALDGLRDGEVRWTGTIEENVCALATVIARQVLGRELALDIEPVAELVKLALSEFPVDQPIRIRVNPSDLNALSSVGIVDGDPLRAITQDREARWLADTSIAPGGCMVEGRERIVDGRIDTALERVYRRLTYTNA